MRDDINNGGKTGYYDIPAPTVEKIARVLTGYGLDGKLKNAVEDIYKLFPQTLNDLIEHKNMKPWQHEVMKAVYAIDDRAKKNGGSEIREINKIIYYANRGKQLASK